MEEMGLNVVWEFVIWRRTKIYGSRNASRCFKLLFIIKVCFKCPCLVGKPMQKLTVIYFFHSFNIFRYSSHKICWSLAFNYKSTCSLLNVLFACCFTSFTVFLLFLLCFFVYPQMFEVLEMQGRQYRPA